MTTYGSMTDNDHIRAIVVAIALHQIGYGEVGGNNRGPFVEALGAPPGDPWCGFLAGWIYQEAFAIERRVMPFARTGSAKRLIDNLATVGERYMDPIHARPGDLLAINRGKAGATTGHAMIVIANSHDGFLWTLQGNVGNPPALVDLFHTDATHLDLYAFASLGR